MFRSTKKTAAVLMSAFALALILSAQVFAAAPKLNKTKASLNVGKKVTLKVTGAKVTKWKTSDKTVATVKNGVVTAKKAGKVTIKAVTAKKTLSCKVTVKNPAVLNKTKATISINQSLTLKVKKVTGTVKWRSKNTSIAYVSSTGKVTGLAAGTTKIVATIYGKKLTCKVTVKQGETLPDSSMMAPWNSAGEEVPKAGNEYTGSEKDTTAGRINISPKHLYYKNGKFYAECFVVNGYSQAVHNVKITRLTFTNGNGKMAEAAFGVLNGGASIPAGATVITTFCFPAEYARINADLTGYLSWNHNFTYS